MSNIDFASTFLEAAGVEAPKDLHGKNLAPILKGETPDAAHIPSGCRFHPRCPKAFDRCVAESPPLFDLGGGHAAACWLAEPGIATGGRALPVVEAARTGEVGA